MLAEWDPDDPRRSVISLRKQLIASGWTDEAIAAEVEAKRFHRVRRGAYTSAASYAACDAAGQHALRTRAVVAQAKTRVAVSHFSALVEWDIPLWDIPLDVVHLTRFDRRAGRKEAGVQQHLGALGEGDVVERNGVLVTSPVRTLLDCLCLVDVEHGLVLVNDALHRGLTTIEELRAYAKRMDCWPGSRRHRVVLRLADRRVSSVLESRFFYLCWEQGLPLPQPQYAVRDEVGEPVFYLDFAWPDRGAFVELDGKRKYVEPYDASETPVDVLMREKRREDLARELTQFRGMRVEWADLSHPAQTAARVRRLLGPSTDAS